MYKDTRYYYNAYYVYYNITGTQFGALKTRGVVRPSLRRCLRRDVAAVAALSVAAFGFVLFFPLHPPVLEPYLDLPLGQAQGVRDLDPPPPGQVPVEVKLLLQLQRLVPGVRLPAPFPL